MAPLKNRPLKVFLCHSKANKSAVYALYRRLVKDGMNAWLDSENLIPGQNWELEIPDAISNSDVVLVCLSKKSINKEGYVQNEIKIALDKAWTMPEGRIFLIPVRLEKCVVPTRLSSFQWVDLFTDQGYDRLIKALKYKAGQIGLRTYEKPQQERKFTESAEGKEKEAPQRPGRKLSASKTTLTKNILLFTDNEDFVQPIVRWLRGSGCTVSLAVTPDDALRRTDQQRFHLVIADIRFDEDNESSGNRIEFLHKIQGPDPQGQIPVILLATNATAGNIPEDLMKFSLIRKEPGYRNVLLNEVERAFQEDVHINFNLRYDEHSADVLSEVIQAIHWPEGPPANPGLLISEARDLIGRLFRNTETICLAKVQPGLAGTGLIQVSPLWLESGPSPVKLVKVDRLDKLLREMHNYEASVKDVVPLPTKQFIFAGSQHLGAILYSYSENISSRLIEFDDYYRMTSLQNKKAIEISLHRLFFRTCRSWYDHAKSNRASLQNLYLRDLHLDTRRLIEQLGDLLPESNPDFPYLTLPESQVPLINPFYWLKEHERQCLLTVKTCITHGDLTGQNIVVDGKGTCWLIDFERTHESHSLRDFVMLETDLKYRLGSYMPDPEFMEFEKILTHGGIDYTEVRPPAGWSKDTKKLYSVINTVRRLARQVAFGVVTPSQANFEYKVSLLMTTLKVIQLRYIPAERKMQALRSASMICESMA